MKWIHSNVHQDPWLEIEHGSFTPLVFSCFGGMSRECSYFYKRLSEKLAEKRNLSVSEAMCFVRTRVSFSLVKSLVLCIRGSGSVRKDTANIADWKERGTEKPANFAIIQNL